MSDDLFQESDNGLFESDDTEIRADETLKNGVRKAGNAAKDISSSVDKGLEKLLNNNQKNRKNERSKAGLSSEEASRKSSLMRKKKQGFLTSAEEKELNVLTQAEKKAKAAKKAAFQKKKANQTREKLPEFQSKSFDFMADGVPVSGLSGNKLKDSGKEVFKHFSKNAESFADDTFRGDEENWGGEAAVEAKNNVEGAYDFLSGTTKSIKNKAEFIAKKSAKKNGSLFKADKEYLQKDFLGKNTKKAAKTASDLQKEAQRRKIKREYAKALAQGGKTAANATSKAATLATGTAGTAAAGGAAAGGTAAAGGAAAGGTAASAGAAVGTGGVSLLVEILLAVIAVIVIIVVILIIIFILMTAFAGTVATTSILSATSYSSERSDLEDTEEYITSLELALEDEINSIESTHPDYDEYKYNLASIGHNAFDLSNYLNSKYPSGYTFSDIKTELDSLFDEMYDLTLESKTETRIRYPECDCDHCHEECGEHCDCEDPEEYEVEVLYVTLTKKELTSIADANLTDDEKLLYEAYEDTGGLIQIFGSPLNMDWLNAIGRNYGSSRNPSTGSIENHKGIDVNVSPGMEVYAATEGTVTAVGNNSTWGNYISIKRSGGEVIKFAHLQSVNVSVGDSVTSRSVVGYTGSTGTECNGLNQIHIETLDADGNYINPVFALETSFIGSTSSSPGYGSSDFSGKNRVEMGLPEEYASGEVEDLISFAEQFIGTPYVWGGSSPGGFDCSGYVSYCVRESGYYPSMQRTDAQSIYELYCTPVGAGEAQAGDLIFFQGTNPDSANTITHVGIYCGDGVMLHAGSPINYCNINTTYWTQHLYGYGHIGL